MDKRKIKKLNQIITYSDHAEIMIDSKTYGKKYALIDLDDVDKVKKDTWCLYAVKLKNETIFYVQSYKKLLHKEIINCPENMEIDHINHNPLDNRKCNLRICTPKENCLGRRFVPKITLYFNNKHKNYVARYCYKGKHYERASKQMDVAISNLKELLFKNNIEISEVME